MTTRVADWSQFVLRRERLTLLVASGATMAVFAIGAAVQSAAIYELTISGRFTSQLGSGSIALRLIANFSLVVAVLGMARAFGLERRRGVTLGILCLATCVCGAAIRGAIQLALGLYLVSWPILIDCFAAMVISALALIVGLVFVTSSRTLRAHELASAEQGLRASAALTALQSEELRVRRQVAEGLHGTVQQSLVLLGTGIEAVADRVLALASTAGDAASGSLVEEVDKLRAVAREVDSVREVDVRQMSQLLYPTGVEHGFVQAARIMLRRLPDAIAVRMNLDEDMRRTMDARRESTAGGESRIARRILMLRILEEAISNALRHGSASTLQLDLAADDLGNIVLTFDDDGTGLMPGQPALNGLRLLGERLLAFGGSLTLVNGPLGGARVVAMLPLEGSQVGGSGLA